MGRMGVVVEWLMVNCDVYFNVGGLVATNIVGVLLEFYILPTFKVK